MDFLQAFGRCYVVGDEVVGHGSVQVMFRASVVFSLTLPPPSPPPLRASPCRGGGARWFTYTLSAQVFVNGVGTCRGAPCLLPPPQPSPTGEGAVQVMFRASSGVLLALPPPRPSPGPHAKCRRILRGNPPAASFALQGRGLWFTYTWSAQVFVSGVGACRGAPCLLPPPQPSPTGEGAVRRGFGRWLMWGCSIM